LAFFLAANFFWRVTFFGGQYGVALSVYIGEVGIPAKIRYNNLQTIIAI